MGTMNDRFAHIEHKGKQLIYCDYSRLDGKDLALQVQLNTVAGIELASQGETRQLVLVDLRDSFINQDVVAALKESAAQVAPFVKASALVGVHGIRKHFLQVVNTLTGFGGIPFDSIEEAKDWLASQ
jgi:hypothetical protein